MAKTPEVAAAAAEKLVEVRLLKNYVPYGADYSEHSEIDAKGREHITKIYDKLPAGSVVELPRSEAKRALDLGIATITADLV
jgi:hypothetical protein